MSLGVPQAQKARKAEGSMMVSMQKWCLVGLVLCATSPAWAKSEDDSDATETRKEKAKSDSGDSGEAADKTDESASEEPAPPPKPKKKAKVAKAPEKPKQPRMMIDLAALGGYGTSWFTHLGGGLRGGVTMDGKEGLYIGGIISYFGGSSVSQDRLTGPAEASRKSLIAGAEAGYDLMASTDLWVRPYLSLGIAPIWDHECRAHVCTNDNGVRLTIGPGLQGVYDFGGMFLGVDLRYQIIMNASNASAAIISATAGMRLPVF
jgi:hypothetical protein